MKQKLTPGKEKLGEKKKDLQEKMMKHAVSLKAKNIMYIHVN